LSLVSQARAIPGRVAEVWSHVNTMFVRTKHNQLSQQHLGSLNSIINDHFQTVNVAVDSSHQSADNFVVPQSSVHEDPFVLQEFLLV